MTLNLIEVWIRRLTVGAGVLVIALPLVRVWRSRLVSRARSSGSSISLTRWPTIFTLATVYVLVGVLLWKPLPLEFSPGMRWVLLAFGIVLYFPGIALYLWGFMTLGPMFGVSSGRGAQLYAEHQLVVRGPYAIIRHPMYTGVILAAIGALMIFCTWAMLVYTPTAFGIILRAGREEQLLSDEFGAAWREYASRVPAWFPRLGR